jgi:hypothetical protein
MTAPSISSQTIALELEAFANFDSTHAQSPDTTWPLLLASRGVQGRVTVVYDGMALPIQSQDIVKVTMCGMKTLKINFFSLTSQAHHQFESHGRDPAWSKDTSKSNPR